MRNYEVKSLIQDFSIINQSASFKERIDFVKKIKRQDFSIRNHFNKVICKKEEDFKNCFLETDYNNHFLEMLVSTACIFRDSDINVKNFPFPDNVLGKIEKIPFKILSIEEYSSAEEIKLIMEKDGLKPANLFQLLSLARDFPGFQTKFPIVALGSSWVNNLDPISSIIPSVFIPFLDTIGGERALRLTCSSSKWSPKFKFLAVKA